MDATTNSADMHRPRVRSRMLGQSTLYCNDRFLRQVGRGIRFIWPFGIEHAFTRSENRMVCSFSHEFDIRVGNIRSLTLSKDFLDQYPEFRGEAPQLEPSLTLHSMSIVELIEQEYWKNLRQGKELIRIPPSIH